MLQSNNYSVLVAAFVLLVAANIVDCGVNEGAAGKDDRSIGADAEPKENNSTDLDSEASIDYFKCVVSPVDVGDLMDDYLNAKTTNDLLAIPTKACKMMSRIKSEMANCASIMDTFLDNNEKEKANNFPNVTEELVSFLCGNNGKNLTSFLFNGGLSCMTKTEQSTSECIRNISVDNNNADNTMSDMSLLVSFFKSDEYHCNIFSRIRQCIVKEVKNCNQLTSSMFESLFAIARKSTPCSKFNIA